MQRLAEEEPDPDDDQGESPALDDRRTQREIAQLVTGGDGSHSRTDPDLLGLDLGGSGLSAEEAALHVTELPRGSRRTKARLQPTPRVHAAGRSWQRETEVVLGTDRLESQLDRVAPCSRSTPTASTPTIP